ncbi:methyl-accepting chemotaxis protein [Caldicellulosiruptor naganoensis]|uniref:Methyl-accepting chemotaxis protein n=1 Tax=Caldicellulosiruptor naganoensis TaxID=29324 RepID=A0ABY7BFG6_9FIRM|nr:methyl-accepting chemotaxis protein [Caldicellulosiruptor naganoensis]WAM31553.1 methyl-accepting chemotaxis protein [Caldicellulosiruptor naganoensis]
MKQLHKFKKVSIKISGSLKTRITLWFIIISLIPLLVFLIFSLSLIEKNAQKELNSRLEAAHNLAIQEIERYQKLSQDYATLISSNNLLKEAILKKDHLRLVQVISPLASQMNIDQIAVTDSNGILIGRSDILSRYGDNWKENYLVKCGLARLRYTTIEKSGDDIYIKSVSDVVTEMSANNMRVIGAVIVGYKLDKRFVENLSRLTKMSVVLYPANSPNKYISQSNSQKLGAIIEKETLQKAMSGEYEYLIGKTGTKNDSYSFVLIPVRKANNTMPVAALAILTNNLLVSNFVTSSIRFSILLFGLTLVLVIIISMFIANRITRPINKLVDSARKVASGKFDIQAEDGIVGSDEIGLLAREFSKMVKSIYTFVTNIDQTVSTTQSYIDRLNSIATDSAKTNEITAAQIKEIIELAEKQKKAFEEVSNYITEIEQQVQNTFKVFRTIEEGITSVVDTTYKEEESIQNLIKYMYTVNETINQVASDLSEAMQNYKSIVSASEYISKLAEQIKIISLNVSIEAAKRDVPSFGVIASEISRLSQTADSFAKQISESIEKSLLTFNKTNKRLEESMKVVKAGVEVAKKSTVSLSKIKETNTAMKERISKISSEISNQQEKILNINNTLKLQTQTTLQYFKTLSSIKDVFQKQIRSVDKLIEQFKDVHEGVVKLAAISIKAGEDT